MPNRTLILVLAFCAFSTTHDLAAAPRLHLRKVVNSVRVDDVRGVLLPDSKRQVSHLAKKLKMNGNQGKDLRAILADRDYQIHLVRGSELLSERAKSDRIEAILVDCNDQIESVLSQNQKQKFEEVLVRQGHRERKNRVHAALNDPDVGELTNGD